MLNSEFSWNFELKARPPSEFKLFKDNKEIKLSDRINITNAGENKFAIMFKKIEASDLGVYKVTATNKCGNASSQATLSVLGAPVIVRKPNPEVSVAEKKAIKVEFEVTGLPLPEIEWFKNDVPLSSEGKIKLETRLKTIHTFALDNAALSDASKITFKAKNDTGEASESFNLIVQSKLRAIKTSFLCLADQRLMI